MTAPHGGALVDQEFSNSSRTLGEHIGILAVDMRRFSGYDNAQQETLVEVLPEVLAEAAERAGLPQLWTAHRFRAFRGDGYLIGFDADLVGAVVDRFFDSLQGTVRRRAGALWAKSIRLQLRTSLHLGPVQSFNELVADSPTGRVMVDSSRMVDAEAVRTLLDRSDPSVTFVASVVSRAVMEHVVEAGHTTRRPTEFVEAQLEVAAKEYSGTAYLRVPAPSGELLRSGLLVNQVEEVPESAQGQPPHAEHSASNEASASRHAGAPASE